MLFVLSAPSGTGKTTIARKILALFDVLEFSVSATTRTKRPVETDGKDYFFLSRDQFQEKIDSGGLVEWEEIFGSFYGTLKSQIDEALREDRHLLFDVDVKGALRIKELYGEYATLIFIVPPSIDVLKQRLEKRGTDPEQTILLRLSRAEWELAQADRFDRIVVNDDLARAVSEVEAIVSGILEVETKK
jgi:guanylate kinase